jgi:glucosyl-3-phosphoglycerate synthase
MQSAAKQWFAASTSHATAWPLERLRESKGTRRIAVVIPARNETATISEIVSAIHSGLVLDAGLVDELVVMDSRSTDDTAERAAAAGAQVHNVDQVRPDLGAYAGKGEAIWKSQFVTDADIVVFVDGDLTQWGLHFVSGLLGPLLEDEQVLLCKGFYDRSFTGDGAGGSITGGRVTELVARPLLNLFWPELAAVVQPLGGEWAIRRELLSALPIPVGYGVEFATLVDTWAARGLSALAQVDLGERGHSHQSVHDLGVMAAEILTVAGRRLGVAPVAAGELAQFQRVPGSDWVARTVPVDERPPHSTMTPHGTTTPHGATGEADSAASA